MPYLNISNVPKNDLAEDGYYTLEVIGLDYGTWDSGKARVKGQYVIVDGPASLGKHVFENYTIGVEGNLEPEGEIPLEYEHPGNDRIKPGTIVPNFGARQLGRLFRYGINIPPADELQEMCAEAEGKRFDAKVTISTQQDGQYAGRQSNSITEYHLEGTQTLDLVSKGNQRRTATAEAVAKTAQGLGIPSNENPRRRTPSPQSSE